MNRLHYIDHIKTLAILLVFLTHAHEAASVVYVPIQSFLYTLDRMAVPFFLMCSGILILENASNKGLSFIKKRTVIQYIFLLIFYSILTNFLYYYLIDEVGLLNSFLKAFKENNIVIFGENYQAIQLWYLMLYIPLYLASPFIGRMVCNCTNREIFLFITFCALMNQIPNTIEVIFGFKTITSSFYKDFSGACLIYFIFGYWLRRVMVERYLSLPTTCFITLILSLIILTKVAYESYIWRTIPLLNWYQSSASILITSLLAFTLLYSHLRNSGESKITRFISKYSFGAYLTHVIILIIVKSLLKNTEFVNDTISYTILLFSSASLSILFVWLMSRTKVLNWMVGGR